MRTAWEGTKPRERAKQRDFVFDEKAHAYFLDGKPMIGCTTALGVIAKPALVPWAAKMAVGYIEEEVRKIAEKNDSIEWVKEFGDQWARILKEAKGAHARKRDKAADDGTELHAAVEEWVGRCIEENKGEPVGGKIDLRIRKFIEWAVKEKIRFLASEKRLYSEQLWVAGTCDLMFEKDGKRYLGDIKTYKKIWDRVPVIQCAGYALMAEEMGEEKFDGYCIVCLPKERAFNEVEDVLWSWDTEGDREAFVSAVKLYKYLQQK